MAWEDDADDDGTIACQVCGTDLDRRDERADLVEHRMCLDCAEEVEDLIGGDLDEMHST